jgi:hypothetical protein
MFSETFSVAPCDMQCDTEQGISATYGFVQWDDPGFVQWDISVHGPGVEVAERASVTAGTLPYAGTVTCRAAPPAGDGAAAGAVLVELD